ncbi:metallopeptidase TldD-related protein [Chryseolinea sp. T2]|uniref:metallopeptidase TldD-related protein n=1 Tax=Chryseolinea sp. T2 TaxID=3129255 RepID=UPI0030768FDE
MRSPFFTLLLRRAGYALLIVCSFHRASAQQDSLMSIVADELNREFAGLSKADVPAYYMHYYVNDIEYATISASFGSLVHSSINRNRILSTQVRLGNYQFDNTHPGSIENGEFGGFSGGAGARVLPLDNDRDAIQTSLWQAATNEYKLALDAYKALRDRRNNTDSIKSSIPDFSKESPLEYHQASGPSLRSLYRKEDWEKKIRSYSARFLSSPHVVSGDVAFRFSTEQKYFLSSEGARIRQYVTSCYVNIAGTVRATDGDLVPLHLSYYAEVPEKLPSDDKVFADVANMVKLLDELRNAPLAEPYSGPAILLAPAAGVFFHEIFGHRIEGHRLKNEYDGQTFKSRINEPVLPKTLTVTFDPTINVVMGQPVNGAYQYDDEGVKSKKVVVVDKGVLKTFLMSRTPLDEVPHSNGHARAAIGNSPVSRQSNLIVESSKAVSMDDLRKMLLKECRKQGKRYGYLFKEVVGGFTVTDRYNPNAFNIFPTLVYRIYADGRPDELVRGVDLIGTPLAMFAEIQAAANDRDVFIGFCGAESGSVPVSASAPSLFVRRIETQKKPRQYESQLLLERPSTSDH